LIHLLFVYVHDVPHFIVIGRVGVILAALLNKLLVGETVAPVIRDLVKECRLLILHLLLFVVLV